MSRFAVGVIVILLWASEGAAQTPSAYRCTIVDAVEVSDAGELVTTQFPQMILDLNEEFVVDRTTGRILGGSGLANHNAFGTPEILDPGSDEQSFKVITLYRPFVTVALLDIHQFREGLDKPFTYRMAGGVIISGTCREF
jgi:hypothetical protein